MYQHYKKPFLTTTLNRMEQLSLIVASTTTYAGMYFITGQHYDYYQSVSLQWIFFILLMLPNFAFFFYWLFYMGFEFVKFSHARGERFFCIISLGLCNYNKFKERYMN
mmetsp:Transcript_2615/g.2507  ORF Transcript_2615/g.2507 Transcript_2615/m.2507 type:complete len:108 (-) Transcript_2615:426-749(-)